MKGAGSCRSVGRRAVLAGAAAVIGAGSARAQPALIPEAPTLLVAGPPGGSTDQWAAVLAEPLTRALHAALGHENVGGPDGVTGANHFQTSTPPDGTTALLLPAAAALSWLVGDQRVRFDAGTWLPLWGGTISAMVASRGPLVRGRRVRVAVRNLVGPELAVLLALECMGLDPVPVAIEPGAATPFNRTDIDVVFLRGAGLTRPLAEMAPSAWNFGFGLGVIGSDGRTTRDPAFPSVPTALELCEPGGASRGGAGLTVALRSVLAAATLDVALVLPLLCPAATVAWWRQGCAGLGSNPGVQAEASRNLVRPTEAGQISASLGSITAEPAVLLELRRWLAERHQWHPG